VADRYVERLARCSFARGARFAARDAARRGARFGGLTRGESAAGDNVAMRRSGAFAAGRAPGAVTSRGTRRNPVGDASRTVAWGCA
jgi:hypothetical protein